MTNAFFKTTDVKVSEIGGYELLPSWWSRGYEYAWAAQFTGKDLIVADMGAGWSGRPFKEYLAQTCRFVYAVDKDNRIHDLKAERDNLAVVVADFENETGLPPLDRIFCISVLEDLTDYTAAMKEFYRLLKPGGLLVITCDSQYDFSLPLGMYPGVSFSKLFNAMQDAGFALPRDIDIAKENVVFHEEWNLCCFHMVVEKDK